MFESKLGWKYFVHYMVSAGFDFSGARFFFLVWLTPGVLLI